jgi:hypothetical protein
MRAAEGAARLRGAATPASSSEQTAIQRSGTEVGRRRINKNRAETVSDLVYWRVVTNRGHTSAPAQSWASPGRCGSVRRLVPSIRPQVG